MRVRWGEHWKKEGEDCCYVDMSPQRLIDPVVHPELVLTSAVIRRAGITRYEGMNRMQVSGCSIEEHDADLIRKLFDRQFSDREPSWRARRPRQSRFSAVFQRRFASRT